MSREWKPGDVAMVRLATRSEAEVAIFDGAAWTVRKGMTADPIEEPRPVVVIDPEDRKQVERLLEAYHARYPVQWASDHDVIHADNLQAALRSLLDPPKPPKPDEPTGLGAVVEDADGERWLRHCGQLAPWHRSDAAPSERAWRYYSGIDAVRVLSPGVTA